MEEKRRGAWEEKRRGAWMNMLKGEEEQKGSRKRDVLVSVELGGKGLRNRGK